MLKKSRILTESLSFLLRSFTQGGHGYLALVGHVFATKVWFGAFTYAPKSEPEINKLTPLTYGYLGVSVLLGLVKIALAHYKHFQMQAGHKEALEKLAELEQIEKELVEHMRILQGSKMLLDVVQGFEESYKDNQKIWQKKLEDLTEKLQENGTYNLIARVTDQSNGEVNVPAQRGFALDTLANIVDSFYTAIADSSIPIMIGLSTSELYQKFGKPSLKNILVGAAFGMGGATGIVMGVSHFYTAQQTTRTQHAKYREIREQGMHNDKLFAQYHSLIEELTEQLNDLGMFVGQTTVAPNMHLSINDDKDPREAEQNQQVQSLFFSSSSTLRRRHVREHLVNDERVVNINESTEVSPLLTKR